MRVCAYGSGFKLIFGSVHVEKRGDSNQQSPPMPITNTHELSDILLNTTNGDVLGLKKGFNISSGML